MSFGTYERQVRDRDRPYGARLNALGGCVQCYRPLGYLATFGYLVHVAGPLRRDEAALVRAVDALARSRALWLMELRDSADRRRAAKGQGRRSPAAAELNPHAPDRWYGDERRAATFAIGFLLNHPRRKAGVDADVVALASRFLAGGVPPAELGQIDALRQRCRRLLNVSAWPHVDQPNFDKARESLRILHLLDQAAARLKGVPAPPRCT